MTAPANGKAGNRRTIEEPWFSHLLVALIAIYVGNPVAESLLLPEFGTLERIITNSLLAVLMIAAVRVSSAHVAVFRLAAALAAVAVAIQFLFETSGNRTLLIVSLAGFEGVLALSTVTLGAYLIRARKVNGHTIRAAICFYLLMAMQWAFLSSLVSIADPERSAFPKHSTPQLPGSRSAPTTRAPRTTSASSR